MTDILTQPASLEMLRPLLQRPVDDSHRKALGQCFTGMRTGRLLAALAGSSRHGRVLDPMAGRGDLLEASAERSARTKGGSELFGVEIESSAAQLAKLRLNFFSDTYGVTASEVVCADAFSLNVWRQMTAKVPFDLVITNPPFVRYQSYPNGIWNPKLDVHSSDDVRESLAAIVREFAPPSERSIWDQLVRAYSGLADFSLPCWLLCSVLTKPGGTLAMVVPQAWLNRDYARVARYALLRFFEPLVVVQESGQRWFEALVPVSLVVARRLSASASLVPLHARINTEAITTFADVESRASSAKSHVGTAFPGRDPEGQFTRWVGSGCIGRRPGINASRIPWKAQCEELFSLCRKARWFCALEGSRSRCQVRSNAIPPQSIPSAIQAVLPRNLNIKFQRLDESVIRTGQGLRTGCNDFFYLDAVEDVTEQRDVLVRNSALFGGRVFRVPRSVIRPVARKQVELTACRLSVDSLQGRVLDLEGYFLPEDIRSCIPRDESERRESKEYRVMPPPLADHVRLATRTYLERNKRRTLIPELSAVRPNGLGPDEILDSFREMSTVAPRMWYMLPPFTARHLAPVFLPRIVHDSPRPVLNCSPPILVDANFSTLWPTDSSSSGDLIFGLFSSTWAELCMEALGTPLGGGALKLEATQIRQIPLPILSDAQKTELTGIVRSLRCQYLREAPALHLQIDKIVVSALFGKRVKASDFTNILRRLSDQIVSLRCRRRLANLTSCKPLGS